jgi:hypothetical protein
LKTFPFDGPRNMQIAHVLDEHGISARQFLQIVQSPFEVVFGAAADGGGATFEASGATSSTPDSRMS